MHCFARFVLSTKKPAEPAANIATLSNIATCPKAEFEHEAVQYLGNIEHREVSI